MSDTYPDNLEEKYDDLVGKLINKQDELDTAVEALEDCEAALERLPDDCLGFNRTRDGKYSFKSELLSKVKSILSEIGGD